MPITKIKYVMPGDPCGRFLLETIAEAWIGESRVPHFETDRFVSAQVEVVANGVRLYDDTGEDGWYPDWDTCKERAYRLIQGVVAGALDRPEFFEVALSTFADEYPQRFEDDYLFGPDSVREAFISDVRDFATQIPEPA